MQRRTLLARTTAAGSALALAGCLRRGRDEDVLSVANSDFREGEDGRLVYVVTISNPSDREASGTVYVNSELNGNASTQVRQVTLDPHSTTSFNITYDIDFFNVSSFQPSVDLDEA
jgi:hypothetical protein